MSFIKKLFGAKEEPKKRVRVCVECGMPVEEHKEWCAILKGQQAMDAANAKRAGAAGQA